MTDTKEIIVDVLRDFDEVRSIGQIADAIVKRLEAGQNKPTTELRYCHFDGREIPVVKQGWHPTTFEWGTVANHPDQDIIIDNIDFGKLFRALAGQPV